MNSAQKIEEQISDFLRYGNENIQKTLSLRTAQELAARGELRGKLTAEKPEQQDERERTE